MSGSISGLSGGSAGMLDALIANATTVRQQLDQLTQQASTGYVATSYAGLGDAASVPLDLNPQIARLQTWQANIDAATGRMAVTQTAMTQIGQIAANFYAQLNTLNGLDAGAVDSVAASARQALQQVAGLLDTTDGGTNVFAGQDSANPPVPNPDGILASGFYTQISMAVAGLGASGAGATAAATLAVASSNASGTSPFSAALSQPAATVQANQATVQVGAGQNVAVGLLASANTFVTSGGSSTTGSYMRDLLRGLATIGSLSSSQVGDAGFQGLVQDTRTSLSGAITAMNQDAGVLGNIQSGLAATRTTLGNTATALIGQVSAAQDVNMAATLSKLSLVQTQLQSSYKLIASAANLSLVQYL